MECVEPGTDVCRIRHAFSDGKKGLRAVRCRRLHSWAVLLASAALLIAGCATAPPVSITRTAPTGIQDDSKVAVMLLFHERCAEHRERTGDNCAPSTVTGRMNDEVATCLRNALQGAPRRVDVIPGHQFHTQFLTRYQADYETLSAHSTLALLARHDLRGELLQARIGFVVLLHIETREHDRRTSFDVGEKGGWGVGRRSKRTTHIVATVWSTEQSVEAGVLTQRGEGLSGWVVPVLLVIPLPPIPYSSGTESKACRAMGNALAEFLYSDAKPLR